MTSIVSVLLYNYGAPSRTWNVRYFWDRSIEYCNLQARSGEYFIFCQKSFREARNIKATTKCYYHPAISMVKCIYIYKFVEVSVVRLVTTILTLQMLLCKSERFQINKVVEHRKRCTYVLPPEVLSSSLNILVKIHYNY